MSYLKLRSFIISLLKDESGTNAVEYALTMVFGAVFIIGALLKLGLALNTPSTDVTVCLTDVANCTSVVTAGGVDNQGGKSGDIGGSNGSGLGDGTNPGLGSGQNNSPNEGVNNPGGQRAVEVRGAARQGGR